MSEPRIAGILMVITGAFLMIPVLILGIASIFLLPLPTLPSMVIWALTIIVFALAILNLGAGTLLLSKGNDSEVRTLGIVVAVLNLIFTWFTLIGIVFAILELVFLI